MSEFSRAACGAIARESHNGTWGRSSFFVICPAINRMPGIRLFHDLFPYFPIVSPLTLSNRHICVINSGCGDFLRLPPAGVLTGAPVEKTLFCVTCLMKTKAVTRNSKKQTSRISQLSADRQPGLRRDRRSRSFDPCPSWSDRANGCRHPGRTWRLSEPSAPSSPSR